MIVNYESFAIGFLQKDSSGTVYSVDVTDYEYTWDDVTGELVLTRYVGSDSDINTPTLVAQDALLTINSEPNTASILITCPGVTSGQGIGTASLVVPYGSLVMVTVSLEGYTTEEIPITVNQISMSRTITIGTSLDLGQITLSIDGIYDFGSITQTVTDSNIDAGTL